MKQVCVIITYYHHHNFFYLNHYFHYSRSAVSSEQPPKFGSGGFRQRQGSGVGGVGGAGHQRTTPTPQYCDGQDEIGCFQVSDIVWITSNVTYDIRSPPSTGATSLLVKLAYVPPATAQCV